MAGHTAFAINLLGYGESDRPLDAEFGIAAQTEYVDRALSGLHVPRAAVVGVDLGGAVALRLGAVHADRVSHLALVNGLTAESTPAGDVRALQHNTARYVLRVASGLLGAAALLRPLLEGSVADPRAMPDRLVARYLAPYVGRDGVAHLLALARAVDAADMRDIDPSTITVPTLIVRSEQDRWLAARVAESLAAAIPDAALVRLADVGRLVPEEAPDLLADRILELLVRSPAAR
jgi:pimeloyl-ACP methyl ester carboxylesterase